MSSEITTARVQQYKAEVFHLSQQKGSRLQMAVRNETQQGKSAFYDRLGAATAVQKTSRHSDTPQIDSAHSRRRVTLVDYEWADLIDKEDLRRLIMNPSGKYAEAAAWALGRAKDDKIIEVADGSAFGGEDGSTTVNHPDAQKYAFNDTSVFDGVNVLGLRAIKRILDANDVDESIPRHAAINAVGLESLLGETEVTSSDFATVKALVQGEVDSFMGFKFHRLERLNTQVDALSGSASTGAVGSGSSLIGDRRCLFWAMDGLLLATSADISVEIDRRADKSYSTQVYASMGIGATRMEEEKVVVGFASES
jgi:hypothetical protein